MAELKSSFRLCKPEIVTALAKPNDEGKNYS